ncbi:hypothetical protein QBC41DRAFT_372939 [Cercophora samala]|uniref:Uncharacterized protein n=1 Tax=Cercophora samala TaxID=330535 RepID=A0AA39ZEY9_9PEZI|nr:hypothetical protein QBC41DRAFT_372939 [Cercophora samala]
MEVLPDQEPEVLLDWFITTYRTVIPSAATKLDEVDSGELNRTWGSMTRDLREPIERKNFFSTFTMSLQEQPGGGVLEQEVNETLRQSLEELGNMDIANQNGEALEDDSMVIDQTGQPAGDGEDDGPDAARKREFNQLFKPITTDGVEARYEQGALQIRKKARIEPGEGEDDIRKGPSVTELETTRQLEVLTWEGYAGALEEIKESFDHAETRALKEYKNCRYYTIDQPSIVVSDDEASNRNRVRNRSYARSSYGGSTYGRGYGYGGGYRNRGRGGRGGGYQQAVFNPAVDVNFSGQQQQQQLVGGQQPVVFSAGGNGNVGESKKKANDAQAKEFRQRRNYPNHIDQVHVMQSFDDDINWVNPHRSIPNIMWVKVDPLSDAAWKAFRTTIEAQMVRDNRGPYVLQGKMELIPANTAREQRKHAMDNGGIDKPCVGCNSTKHSSDACAVPGEDGYCLVMCGYCHDVRQKHLIEDCPELKKVRYKMDEVSKVMLDGRINKAQYKSGLYDAWDFVPSRLKMLDKTLDQIKHMASSDPEWTIDRKAEYMPWSVDFAETIASAERGDEILRGKPHPLDATGDMSPGEFVWEHEGSDGRLTYADLAKEFLSHKVTPFGKKDYGFPSLTYFVPDKVLRRLVLKTSELGEILLPTVKEVFQVVLQERKARRVVLANDGQYRNLMVEDAKRGDIDIHTWTVDEMDADGRVFQKQVHLAPEQAPPIHLVSRGAYRFSFIPDKDGLARLQRNRRGAGFIYSFDLESILLECHKVISEFKEYGTIYTYKIADNNRTVDMVALSVAIHLFLRFKNENGCDTLEFDVEDEEPRVLDDGDWDD